MQRSPSDFRLEWIRGSGAGGQHQNKHANSARLTHLPTGIVETRQSRERTSNLEEATQAIQRRLDEMLADQQSRELDATRQSQIGSGQRGDKIRTYRIQDDRVTDDRTGKTASASNVLNGRFNLVW